MAFNPFGIDFSGILSAIQTFLGPFGKLLDSLKQIYNHVTGIFNAADKLKDSVLGEIDGWKNFKQDLRFAQRVVNLERAIQKTRDLIEGIPASWKAIQDLISEFKKSITGGEANPIEEADAAAQDVESAGIKALLTKFPKLARALERVLGVLAVVVQALESIANAIDDLQTIVDELKRVRLEVEKLDTIFLPQSNKRRRVTLADGSTMNIRVGKLHA